jgi:hypothetical protein
LYAHFTGNSYFDILLFVIQFAISFIPMVLICSVGVGVVVAAIRLVGHSGLKGIGLTVIRIAVPLAAILDAYGSVLTLSPK